MLSTKPSTLVDLLRSRALYQPNQHAYTFLLDGEKEGPKWTYAELDRHARAIGSLLRNHNANGERVLLLYPPGLEFIAAFFGCLYAGAIAVPAYPPRNRRYLTRIQTIVEDAQARILLTIEKTQTKIQKWLSQTSPLNSLRMLATDNLPKGMEKDWQEPDIDGSSLAFLQYTSGSTSVPKGVMVSYDNLLHNSELIQQYFGHSFHSKGVIWLPPYHDMGLIGGIVQPLFVGFPVILMSPAVFLQRPVRWLEAISNYRATSSGGPNFAYELCVTKITPEQRKTLDLSSWNLAFNGAEPIHPETLENFVESFESCGFRKEAFYPCYGLAEATLFVTGGKKSELPIVQTFRAKEMEHNRVIESPENKEKVYKLIGCGQNLKDQTIVIVGPETLTKCLPDQIGEIWISGPGVAQGYWNRPDISRENFQAYLADTAEGAVEGPFLRTGDLGFIKDGELFITGRIKDLIIIRGRNHYPQDIEWTVEHSHPAIRQNCSAAFSVNIAGEERLVVVAEVERRYIHRQSSDKKKSVKANQNHRFSPDPTQVDLEPGFSQTIHQPPDLKKAIASIRQTVAEHHDLQVYAVLLLKATTILRTSSGKIQRHLCKAGFLKESIDVVGKWFESPIENILDTRSAPDKSDKQKTAKQYTPYKKPSQPAEAIQNWLISKISERLGLKPHEIDIREPFARYGIDSVQAVSLSAKLEDWLGYPLSPTLIYNYPNIAVLSRYLSVSSEIADVAAKIQTVRRTGTELIAVIGLGCRFPGAKNPEALWHILHNGVDAITEVSPDRWDINAFYDPTPATPGKMSTRWGGFLEHVDLFDPEFFGLSPRETENMDPQQRLLLEVAWEALENTGQAPELLAGSYTGVFIGISNYDYSRLQNLANMNAYTGTGNAMSIAANRLSYFLNLRGPSVAIDTACSSSLVAVHHACLSLRNKECDLALAGGVNLILTPEATISLSQTRLMAADGRCKTFDSRADGYVRGEGCGIVVLKRLSDALRDGDDILALIRGSAVNQDGRSNGLTAPNGFAQQAVIYQALENAGVVPSQISYFEAHGTGTALGDPIEVNALKEVLIAGRSPEHPCWIGSVKTNIGHLEAASGIAGLIKTVLALQHEEIPPHLHLKQLNSNISLEGTPFLIPTRPQKWLVGKDRRLAGVSSFGFGGTNAHIVVEETLAKAKAASEVERPVHILTLSARSENALEELAMRYKEHIESHEQVPLTDVCFTANTGRTYFDHRLAIITESRGQIREQLEAFGAGKKAAGLVKGRVRPGSSQKIAFLFSGQGSQYVGMGRQLYETQPTFRQALDRCNKILRPYLEKPLLEVLYPESYKSEINMTAYTQPALFALEYALAQLWMSWKIIPAAVMGHSVGEYAAACVAKVFSLEDGLKLIAARARLMQALPRDGKMVAVFAEESQVAEAIQLYAQEVSIAAINGPKIIVISGKSEAIDAVTANLHAAGVRTKQLQVSHAFHSSLMDPMLVEFEQVAKEVTYSPPWIEIISDVSGKPTTTEITVPEYWCDHIRQPVQFKKSIETLREEGYKTFIEIGPTPTLLGMGRQVISDCEFRISDCEFPNSKSEIPNPKSEILWLPSLRQRRSDWQQLLQSLGELHVQGIRVDWAGFDRDYPRRRVALPTYPFQRKRYWIETSKSGDQAAETLSQENVQTPFITLLNQGNIEQLVQFLEKAEEFSEEQRRVLPDLLEVFVKQYQQQVTAASVKDWFYQIEWQPRSRQSKTATGEIPTHESGSWLIFADQEGLGQTLSELLQERHQGCLLVYAGDTYKALNPGIWSLNPASPEDFERLFHEVLETSESPLRGVIHLWSLEAARTDELTISTLEQAQIWGCDSVLHLVQTVASYSEEVSPRLWLVTRGAVAVGDHPVPLSVAQASLWGLGKVVGLEYPEFLGGMFDLDAETTDDEAKTLLAEIWDSEGEDQLAFRAGQRYVARLVRSRLPELQASPLQPEATYLITGGLGALGLKVAQWMVEQGARYLVLTGRRGASSSSQKDAVIQLEQAGVVVLVAQADVSKEDDMLRVLEDMNASMPLLKGIVHAAGVLDDGILFQQNWERFAQVMAPKVKGTWNLHTLTKDSAIDFFVCFSSVASLLGSMGQGNYAAANAFMDVLAHYRKAMGLPCLSINWGHWADTGMAARLDSLHQNRLAAQGLTTIAPKQGLHVFGGLLAQDTMAQVGILPINWSRFLQLFPPGSYPILFSEFVRQEGNQVKSGPPPTKQFELLRRLKEASPDDRHSLLMVYIQEQVAKVLGISASQLDIQQPLNNMGLDSLMAIELRNRLETDLGIEVPMVKFMEGLSVSSLATQVIEQLTEPIQAERLVDQIDLSKGVDLEHAEQILAKLDELDDKKVEELLRAMLSEEEGQS